jgi:hypothetical protein
MHATPRAERSRFMALRFMRASGRRRSETTWGDTT